MNRAPRIASGDPRIALRRHFAASRPRELSKVFAAWLLGKPGNDAGFVSSVENAAVQDGAQQVFQTVAILGFAAQAGVLAQTQIDAFKKGLRRHAGREPVVERVPMAFMSDAVGIFGIAIGARAIADAEVTGELGSWTAKFLNRVYEMERTEDWERCLLAVADRQLQTAPRLAVPDSAAVADVRVVLAAKGFLDIADRSEAREDDLRALVLAVQEPAVKLECDRAVLRLAALNSVIATVGEQSCGPTYLVRKDPVGTRPLGTPPPKTTSGAKEREFGHAVVPPIKETGSADARIAKEARAMTVAKLVKELNCLKPQMLEDESEYSRLRDQYPDFFTFKIAEQRPDLRTKVLAIQGSTRHVRLAQELAGAHHGRQLATIQDDWKDFKPSEFKRVR